PEVPWEGMEVPQTSSESENDTEMEDGELSDPETVIMGRPTGQEKPVPTAESTPAGAHATTGEGSAAGGNSPITVFTNSDVNTGGDPIAAKRKSQRDKRREKRKEASRQKREAKGDAPATNPTQARPPSDTKLTKNKKNKQVVVADPKRVNHNMAVTRIALTKRAADGTSR